MRLLLTIPILALALLGAASPALRAQEPAKTAPPAAAPAPAQAQTLAPAQAQPSATATSEAEVDKTEQSDEEKQVNLFRLEGPVVKWTARTFHVSRETAAVLYEVLNFLLIALLVGVPLYRFLPRHLRTRKQKLAGDIESARKMTEDANARLSAVEAQMAKLDEEIQKFRAEIEAESKHDEAKIKTALAEESARIVEAAEQEIAQAAAQARRGLRSFAADLAIDKAAKELVLTAETDRALIAEFVGDMASNGTSYKQSSGGKH